MEVVLVIHLFLAVAIIGLVLMQRSEGGGLGIGGGGGGGGGAGNFASPRGTASFLTRATAVCAAGFFITSLTLGVMAGAQTSANKGILEALDASQNPPAESFVTPEAENGVDATVTPVNNDETTPAAAEIPADVNTDDNDLPSAPIAE